MGAVLLLHHPLGMVPRQSMITMIHCIKGVPHPVVTAASPYSIWTQRKPFFHGSAGIMLLVLHQVLELVTMTTAILIIPIQLDLPIVVM